MYLGNSIDNDCIKLLYENLSNIRNITDLIIEDTYEYYYKIDDIKDVYQNLKFTPKLTKLYVRSINFYIDIHYDDDDDFFNYLNYIPNLKIISYFYLTIDIDEISILFKNRE